MQNLDKLYSRPLRNNLRFILFACLGYAVFYCLLFGFVEAVDPYNENDHDLFGRYYITRDLTPFKLIRNLERKNATLIFGTSRSHLIDSAMIGTDILNFHCIYGSPVDVLKLLRLLDDNQISHIDRIVYLLDTATFGTRRMFFPDGHATPSDQMLTKIKRFGIDPVMAAFLKLRSMLVEPDWYLAEDGHLVHTGVPFITERHTPKPSLAVEPFQISPIDPEALSDLKGIDDFARQHGLQISYISPTFPRKTLLASDLDQLLTLRLAILTQIPTYSDLTYLDGISDDESLFADPTHLSYQGLSKVIRPEVVNANNVTRDTVELKFSWIKQSLTDAVQ